ncbi:MAG: methionyl-tRNA formyltransferase [Elainellaceae cyanobacterium]
MNIVFFGTPQFAVPSFERLIENRAFDVLAAVTQPDKRRGRGTTLISSPIKVVAGDHHIPVWQPRSVKKDADTLDWLRQSDADAFVVVAYGQILSQGILEMPRLGCVNAHGSILPRYRGAAPIQWCLYHGETETGVTTILMDAGMDTGDMLLKSSMPIGLLDNSLDLAKTLSQMAADLLVETLIGLDQPTINPVPQDHERATYAPLIQKDDYPIDWSRSAIAIHNQVRGFYPNCVTTVQTQMLKVQATVPFGIETMSMLDDLPNELKELKAIATSLAPTFRENPAQPGTVVELIKNYGPVIQTGDGGLLLQTVQLAGKRSQSGWDFVNGTRLGIGAILG